MQKDTKYLKYNVHLKNKIKFTIIITIRKIITIARQLLLYTILLHKILLFITENIITIRNLKLYDRLNLIYINTFIVD